MGNYLGRYNLPMLSAISIVINLALHRTVFRSIVEGYPGDSFYTLTKSAAVGLVILVTVLIGCVLLVFYRLTKSWILKSTNSTLAVKGLYCLINIVIVAVVYLLFLTAAPQVFYTYYQIIFPDLPVQSVIKPIPLAKMLELITISKNASMADHLAGFTFCVLITNTLLQWLLKKH